MRNKEINLNPTLQWAQKPLQCAGVLWWGGVGMVLGAGGIGESAPFWLPNKLLIT